MGKKPKQKSTHPLRDNIEVLVFAVAMALGLKVFAVEAYQIPTGSMMPTLMGTDLVDPSRGHVNGGIHDRVLVDKLSYLFRDPERWEVVVFRYPLVTHNNYVKRLIGLPGEEIKIEHGDLYAAKGATSYEILRKPNDIQSVLWKRVFPIPRDGSSNWPGWTRPGKSRLDGEQVVLEGIASLNYGVIRDEYTHGYPDALHGRIRASVPSGRGTFAVTDLKLEIELTPESGCGAVTFDLEFGPYPVTLTLAGEGRNEVSLSLPDGSEHQDQLEVVAGSKIALEAAFWDHHFEYRIESGSQELNFEKDMQLTPRPAERNGIRVRTEQGPWRIDLPTISRDVHYTGAQNGPTQVIEVPEGHYFMLGDNTQNSHDGRAWEKTGYRFDPPLDGREEIVGDNWHGGQDPTMDNPRWNRDRSLITLRDANGELFQFDKERITESLPLQPQHTVAREYILGKVLAVFLPIPPFSPVFRVRAVR